MARRRKKVLPTEAYEITIESLSHEGRGIAHRPDGKVIFIDAALPEERIKFVYSNRRAKFDEGRCVEILQASEQRVQAECEHYAICGGCTLQHLSSDAQIQHKQSILVELFKHVAETDLINLLPVMQDASWGYRRKARLGVKYVYKKESVLVGFREKRSSFIADIQDCKILDERVACLINPLRDFITTLVAREGIPQIEVACGDQRIALVFRHLQSLSKLDKQAFIDFSKKHDLDVYLQSGGPSTVEKLYSEDSLPEEKLERLSYRLEEFNLEMLFHPMDFTQVNAGINKKMLSLAMELLNPAKDEKILDLFCGLGNFSLPIAKLGAEVVAVEGDQMMVRRGTENANHNGLENIKFYAANLAADFTKESWAQQKFDKILIDPPRSGAFEIVQHIANFGAKSVLYISCNPATLARDAKVLFDKGYEIMHAGVMDMFPQTAHVESIALFRLKNG